jgi:hypothetical protein
MKKYMVIASLCVIVVTFAAQRHPVGQISLEKIAPADLIKSAQKKLDEGMSLYQKAISQSKNELKLEAYEYFLDASNQFWVAAEQLKKIDALGAFDAFGKALYALTRVDVKAEQKKDANAPKTLWDRKFDMLLKILAGQAITVERRTPTISVTFQEETAGQAQAGT